MTVKVSVALIVNEVNIRTATRLAERLKSHDINLTCEGVIKVANDNITLTADNLEQYNDKLAEELAKMSLKFGLF